MTWVVGTNIEFGSVLIAADVRITLPDKREIDCLQKIYPLGFNVIGGFAGSVKIGMETLALLSAQFAQAPHGAQWELGAIVLTWLPRVIRRCFKRHDESYRKLGASFLIGSVSPGRNVRVLFPETKLYAFRSSNDFQPEEISPGETASIGNGRILEDTVREILRSSEFQLAWNSGPRLHSFIFASQLRDRVLKQPMPGVSPRFVMGWVIRGDQGIEPWTTLGTETADREIVLARSLKELDLLVGVMAAGAVG